jgi:hypothetical protein
VFFATSRHDIEVEDPEEIGKARKVGASGVTLIRCHLFEVTFYYVLPAYR